MEQNNVCDLVILPEGSKRVRYKWVFKTKIDSKGNIETRLVAKCFTQKDEINYKEIFSSISKKNYLESSW